MMKIHQAVITKIQQSLTQQKLSHFCHSGILFLHQNEQQLYRKALKMVHLPQSILPHFCRILC